MRKTLAAVIGAVSLTAALGGATLAAASPQASTSGTEHFQLMTTSTTSNTSSVIVYGVFTAFGVDHPGNKVDTVVFPHGTVRIAHSPGKGPIKFNPHTCLLSVNQQGTFTLTGGTGKYAGISGHGTYQLSILAIGPKSGGKCANPQTSRPRAFHEVINASGPVTLP